MRKDIELFNANKSLLTNRLMEYCKDTKEPLEERWAAFILSDFGYHSGWIYDYKTVPRVRDYLDGTWLHEQKYRFISALDVINKLTDDLIDGEPGITQEMIDDTKEDFLQSFTKSYEMDW